MKITNKMDLPQALYDVVVNKEHDYSDGRYSITELLKPTREILLTRKHYNELEQDVSDLVPAMFGSAVHKMFETANGNGDSELKLEYNVFGVTIVGVIDLCHDDVIEDYKTTSVNKVIRKDFNENIQQVVLYAWLRLMVLGVKTNHVKLNYLMKDWSKIQSYTRNDYPRSPVYVYECDINDSDYDWAYTYIRDKIKELNAGVLPECNDQERWYSGTKYAIYKQRGDKRAIKVYDNEIEARNDYPDAYIEKRDGENTKCLYYCVCNKVCDQHRG